MLHRLPDTMDIIDPDVTDAGTRRPHIYKHQRHVPQLEIVEERFFHAEGHYRNAFDAVLEHAPHGRFHSLRIVNRRRHQNLVVVLYRYVFEHVHNFGKEGIRDFRDDQPKDAAASGNEGACLRARKIAEFFDDLPNTLRKLRLYAGMPVNRARHRSGRDSCAFCDFSDVHGWLYHFCGSWPALLHPSDCEAPRSVLLHDGAAFPQKSWPPLFSMSLPLLLARDFGCNRYPDSVCRPIPP